MACTSAGDSKESSGLVALKATSSASLFFLANLLHNHDSVTEWGGEEEGGGRGEGREGGRTISRSWPLMQAILLANLLHSLLTLLTNGEVRGRGGKGGAASDHASKTATLEDISRVLMLSCSLSSLLAQVVERGQNYHKQLVQHSCAS